MGRAHWPHRKRIKRTARSPTIERARDEIRKLKARGRSPTAVNVLVREGLYELPRNAANWGRKTPAPQKAIVYRASEHEKPVSSAGRTITGWQPYRGAILKADRGWRNS